MSTGLTSVSVKNVQNRKKGVGEVTCPTFFFVLGDLDFCLLGVSASLLAAPLRDLLELTTQFQILGNRMS